jgi:hypothetical protein
MMTEQNPIIGDLLEEYREHVRPSRGIIRASVWFARQLASLVRPWMWGTALGAVLGVVNLVGTAYRPLIEDDGAVLLAMAGAVFVAWGAIGYFFARRRARWIDGVTAAFVGAALTMLVSQTANFVRVLTFYDQLQYNPEWHSLMARFDASGMTDLRTFVFVDYARNTPIFVAVFVAAGCAAGALGAAISAARQARSSRARA